MSKVAEEPAAQAGPSADDGMEAVVGLCWHCLSPSCPGRFDLARCKAGKAPEGHCKGCEAPEKCKAGVKACAYRRLKEKLGRE